MIDRLTICALDYAQNCPWPEFEICNGPLCTKYTPFANQQHDSVVRSIGYVIPGFVTPDERDAFIAHIREYVARCHRPSNQSTETHDA